MSTVSTKEIAAIPQADEQETKGISSPLESAESDPVSVMAEPTSTSFMLLPAPGLHKWLYCSQEGNVFRAVRRISFPFSSRQGHTSNTLPGKLPRDLARMCRPQVSFGILHFLVCVCVFFILRIYFQIQVNFVLGKRKRHWTVSGYEKPVNCNIRWQPIHNRLKVLVPEYD